MRRLHRVHQSSSITAASNTLFVRSCATASVSPSASTPSALVQCGLTGKIVDAKDWASHSEQLDYRVASMIAKRLGGEKGDRAEAKHAIIVDPQQQRDGEFQQHSSTDASSSSSSFSGGAAASSSAPIGLVGSSSSSSSAASGGWASSSKAQQRTAAADSSSNNSQQQKKGTAAAANLSNGGKPRPPMYLRFQAKNSRALEPMPLKKLWHNVSRNIHLVQEFNLSKRTRRLMRVNIALKFLRDHHVVMHSALRWCPSDEAKAIEMEKLREAKAAEVAATAARKLAKRQQRAITAAAAMGIDAPAAAAASGTPTATAPSPASTATADEPASGENEDITAAAERLVEEKAEAQQRAFLSGARAGQWNVSAPFHRLLLNGEALVTTETNVRLSKLFPKADDAEAFAELTIRALSSESLGKLFDDCEMGRIIEANGRRASAPSDHQKASMVKALLCELFWFCERTKANDRTHNNALFPPSDVLILHVLAAHVVEALLAEVVFSQVGPIADQLKQNAWPRFTEQHVSQIMKFTPKIPAALALNDCPRAFEEGVDGLRSVGSGAGDLESILPTNNNINDTSSINNTSTTSSGTSLFDKLVQNAVTAALDTERCKLAVVQKAQRKTAESLACLKMRLEEGQFEASAETADANAATRQKAKEERKQKMAEGGGSDDADASTADAAATAAAADGTSSSSSSASVAAAPSAGADGLTKDMIIASIARREQKLVNIREWLAKYERRCGCVVESDSAKAEEEEGAPLSSSSPSATAMQGTIAKNIRSKMLRDFSGANNKNKKKNASSPSPSSSSPSPPLGLVPPLLHKTPFHKDTVVVVHQSNAQMNYKRYKMLDSPTSPSPNPTNNNNNKKHHHANILQKMADKEHEWIGGAAFAAQLTKTPSPAVGKKANATAASSPISLAQTIAMLSPKKQNANV